MPLALAGRASATSCLTPDQETGFDMGTRTLRIRMWTYLKEQNVYSLIQQAEAARQPSVPDLPPVDAEERCVLNDALVANGTFVIEGLAMRDMVHAASIVLGLQRRGFVRTTIQFADGSLGQPERIPVELTDTGRKAIES